ncbi:unnamed protein product [Polarella glacialis]|uniref:RING-type E3 ubiquitin transferase n=1 Tax=Polarella glacialis TaxID=89957 RepID=A0A813DMB2_POLGL|nr:unnamed protein product [Polarella glacialis]CAE8724339.1 unnamed protein product [Polarella glacialis]
MFRSRFNRERLLAAVFVLTLAEMVFFASFSSRLVAGLAKDTLITASLTAAAMADVVRLGQVSLQLFSWTPRLWSQGLSAALAVTQVLLSLLVAAVAARWSLLLLMMRAALDLLVLVLQRPEVLLASYQPSAEVATSRSRGAESILATEYQIQRRLWQQAVDVENLTWQESIVTKVFDESNNNTNTNNNSNSNFDVSTCMVCLADFVAGELLSVLPCGHNFHSACIASWHQHISNNTNHTNNTNNINNNSTNIINSNRSSLCPCRCSKSQSTARTLPAFFVEL